MYYIFTKKQTIILLLYDTIMYVIKYIIIILYNTTIYNAKIYILKNNKIINFNN